MKPNNAPRPSVFDRLMDEALAYYLETSLKKSWTLAEMFAAIWRALARMLEKDIEHIERELPAHEAARRFRQTTGATRITLENFGEKRVQAFLVRTLEKLISKFEPRAWGLELALKSWKEDDLEFSAFMNKSLSEAEIKDAVRRDLEALLNTRGPDRRNLPEELQECSHSLYTYGLPDLSHLGFRTEEERFTLAENIAEALRAFEPRLRNVQVRVGEIDKHNHRLGVAIMGALKIDQVEEQVVFNTVFSPQSGECKVDEAV